MIISKLLEGQEIELEAVAILGKGKTHSKWSPGLFYHHQVTDLKIKKQPDAEEQKNILKIFPKELFEVKTGKLAVKDKKLAMECEDFEGANPNIEITPTDDYILSIESWGQLTPKELVTTAVSVFDEMLEEFQEEVKKIE